MNNSIVLLFQPYSKCCNVSSLRQYKKYYVRMKVSYEHNDHSYVLWAPIIQNIYSKCQYFTPKRVYGTQFSPFLNSKKTAAPNNRDKPA